MSKDKSKTVCIYGLYDPREPEAIRYVGKTERSLRERMINHRHNSKSGHCPVNRWIRKLRRHGISFKWRILEECSEDDWIEKEKHHIDKWRRRTGARFLNITEGGEGTSGWHHTREARQKISEASRERWGKLSIEERRAHLAAVHGKWRALPLEVRIEHGRRYGRMAWEGLTPIEQEIVKACLLSYRAGVPLSKDHRSKLSAALKGREFSEEHRMKISEAHKGKTLTKEHREKLSKAKLGKKLGPRSDEHCRKISEALKRKARTSERVSLGREVVALRERGLSQEKVAEYLGISRCKVRGLIRMMKELDDG